MIADLEIWKFHGGGAVVSFELAQLDVTKSVVTSSERQKRGGLPSYQRQVVSWRYSRFGVAAGVALAVVLAGCTDGGTGTGGNSPTTPAVPAPQQDARSSAEELALDAYRGMWRAYAKAGLTADANEPELAQYASGAALNTLTSGLSSYRSKGHVLKGEYVSNPQATAASPSSSPVTVSVTDCLNDANFLVYNASGNRVDDEPGGRRATRATVSDLGAEGWKVTSFGVQEIGTC